MHFAIRKCVQPHAYKSLKRYARFVDDGEHNFKVSVTAEAQVQSRAGPLGLQWTEWHWDMLFSQHFSFPSHYHSTNAMHTFIHRSPVLYNLSN